MMKIMFEFSQNRTYSMYGRCVPAPPQFGWERGRQAIDRQSTGKGSIAAVLWWGQKTTLINVTRDEREQLHRRRIGRASVALQRLEGWRGRSLSITPAHPSRSAAVASHIDKLTSSRSALKETL